MLILQSNSQMEVRRVEVANKFLKRLIGLAMKKDIPKDYALIFPKCNSIHTWFMKCSLDVICLDQDYKVIAMFSNIQPYQILWPIKQGYYMIEMRAQEVESKIQLGEEVRWEK